MKYRYCAQTEAQTIRREEVKKIKFLMFILSVCECLLHILKGGRKKKCRKNVEKITKAQAHISF